MCLPLENRRDLACEEIYVTTKLGRLYVKAWGWDRADDKAKAPIVLFHDSLGCIEVWRELPERLALATGHPVIAYDRLGFGGSDPHPARLNAGFVKDEALTAFPALKDQLHLDRFIVFGHSVGGGMAIGVASAFPAEAQALITVAAQAFVEDRTLKGIRDAKQAFTDARQFERLTRYHGAKAQWVLTAWTESWLSQEFADWRVDEDLKQVRCPVLVIHGDRDEYGSVVHPKRIGALSAGPATVEILTDCGHVPHRERESDVLAMISRFLEAIAR
jgi:pimeloyl-ACP methyl ester carboxylesterase